MRFEPTLFPTEPLYQLRYQGHLSTISSKSFSVTLTTEAKGPNMWSGNVNTSLNRNSYMYPVKV